MCYRMFTYVLQNSITISVVMIAIILVRGLMVRMPKKYSYLLWAVAGIRLLCPWAPASPVSVFHITEPGCGNMVSAASAWAEDGSPVSGRKEQVPDTGAITDTSAGQVQGTHDRPAGGSISGDPVKTADTVLPERLSTAWFSAAVRYGAPVWLSGTAVLAFWNLYRLLQMKKSLRTAVWYRQNIYECDTVPAPFVTGLLHPAIYLPFRLGRKERAYILAHEQYHIRRRDYIIRPAAYMLACIYWFHPLVWISYTLMVRDMEMSCDEYVLSHASADMRRQYSRLLLSFALNQRQLSAGPVAFGETETGKRVKHVLYFKKHNKMTGILAAALVMITAAVCLTNEGETQADTELTGKSGNMQAETAKPAGSWLRQKADDKKAVREAESETDLPQAVVAEKNIHGCQVQVVCSNGALLTEQSGPAAGMYQGEFEIRTYKNGRKCASHKLDFGFTDELYYPADGFELVVKDYDRDGSADDFTIGQGQTLVPAAGNFMVYQFFAIEEDGSILQHSLSTKEQDAILTIPGDYSADFAYTNGSIGYMALQERGAVVRTAHITTEYQPPEGSAIQSFSDEEIQKAIKTVKKYVTDSFAGCSLQEIWYNGAYQQTASGYFKEQYQTDRVIVLLSDFYVDKTCEINSLEKDSLYAGFMWVLAGDENTGWEVRDYGY